MRHEIAQRSVSEAMDGFGRPPEDVTAHVAGCPVCTGFERDAWRVRELTRFAVAPKVPDLTGDIMARIRAEPRPSASRRLTMVPRLARGIRTKVSPGRVLTPLGRAAVAALVVGFAAGAILTRATLVERASISPLLARQIPALLLGVAEELRGYRARFDITEQHWTRGVPRRSFVADLAFRAPEAFRVTVRDTTRYPEGAWPRNDLRLVTDGRTWSATGPEPCPRDALPACPRSSPVTRLITDRAPFDASTAMPTDVIVPMTVLAGSGRVDVVDQDTVGGREAVVVRLTAEDGTTLLSYLRFMGSWRPFFPEDRMLVWLDRATWFPLRYEVFPAPSIERSAWATQNGLPDEPPDRAIFTATVRQFSGAIPPASMFDVPRGGVASNQGFSDRPTLEGTAIRPAWVGGLTLWRVGMFHRTAPEATRQTVLAYARGLSWLTVTRVEGWDQSRPFGVGPFAALRRLGNGKAARYEPASSSDPRRLALHTSEGEFLIAGNVPRATLERVAASLPVSPIPEPRSWHIHRWAGGLVEDGLTLQEGLDRVAIRTSLPAFLPEGYAAAGARVVRGPTGEILTIVFRHAAAQFGGVGLVYTQGVGQLPAPPGEAGVVAIRIGPAAGRWSPTQHLLEWMDAGTYRSLSSSSIGLPTLLRIAQSLRATAPGRDQ